MPSGRSDRPRQIDAFVGEAPGQHCDVVARAGYGSHHTCGFPDPRSLRTPTTLMLGSLGIPKRKCWSKGTCDLILLTRQSLVRR
jgi:hypothetical protein